ncbi:Rid family detoxifying hydrolase [uncultured Succinatimonas sp.]|uniref:Rid family detoxifying hydrolase n=1 Tax=uncultured Succinatimonas sp. TaxID=1262973 RepID=UPI0025D05FDE|nr:Rid family detoxifying hydrolase [uncultured Succinatimonas sp.]
MKNVISSDKVPAAVGPYSAGIATASAVYLSGQLPINSETGSMPEGIEAQTAQSLKNVEALLESVGLTFDNVVKTTVLLSDIADFAAMNKVYEKTFKAPFPARSAFAVKALPKGALVEIECIAVK